MSRTIYWFPNKNKINLEIKTPSDFIDLVERAFGTLPRDFSKEDLERLRGLSFAEPEMFVSLIEAIEKHDIVRVWAE